MKSGLRFGSLFLEAPPFWIYPLLELYLGYTTHYPGSRLPIADWENLAARRVESVWLAETGAAPENRVFLRTGKI
jgi:hypothetical protein